jgi:hypothetical protein
MCRSPGERPAAGADLAIEVRAAHPEAAGEPVEPLVRASRVGACQAPSQLRRPDGGRLRHCLGRRPGATRAGDGLGGLGVVPRCRLRFPMRGPCRNLPCRRGRRRRGTGTAMAAAGECCRQEDEYAYVPGHGVRRVEARKAERGGISPSPLLQCSASWTRAAQPAPNPLAAQSARAPLIPSETAMLPLTAPLFPTAR